MTLADREIVPLIQVERPSTTKGRDMKVLFLYPNLRGMNMLPPSIAILSALLKRKGI